MNNTDCGTKCDWQSYSSMVKTWLDKRICRPGVFAEPLSEQMWQQSCNIPIPNTELLPLLILPLRIHLSQGCEFGCNLSDDECRNILLPLLNNFWIQAGIQWELVEIAAKKWPNDSDGSRDKLLQLRDKIWSLHRDNETGMMADKNVRKDIFLDNLLSDYVDYTKSYDVYMFDFIGDGSQGEFLLTH